MSKSRLSRLLPKFLRSDKSAKNTSNADSVDSKTPSCSIHFLDDSQHQIQIKGSWKGSQLLDKVCELLILHEKDYFSLRYIDSDGQTQWLDSNKTLSSQFKGCQYPYHLYFGVKFYAADPCKLREEITRYLFFLQVKQDILQGRLPVTFDEAAELCAYALQSELGDYDPRQHTPGYVSEFCFIQNQTEELEARIAAIHRRLGGLVPLLAEYRFLDKVKWLDMYGVDLHPVLGEGSVEYFLGLTPTGIVVYKNKNKVGNYFWPRINKVTFKGKIFIVKVKDKNNEEHAYAFELARKTACKHLWKCCVEHHAFFRLNQTQERNSRQVQVSRSRSVNRRSGRSERQALSDNLSRQSSSVVRLPSRRQPRRINSDSGINTHDNYESPYHRDSGTVTMVMRPEPVRAPRHRSLPELQGRESPRSVKSAPWETNYDYGLYTMGKESPVSARSDRMSQQRSRFVSGSDSESGISQRRKYFPNRRGSDNDSDVSVTRRRRREVDSDSASDISSRYPASHAGHERSKNDYAVLYPFHDKENRPNGSIPSLHSAPAGEARQRRRRRRSKSPGKRMPEELKQHFEYGLKDTDGLSQEQLREIPYVNVETKSNPFKLKYSPKLRQKVKAAKQRSMGDLDQNRNQVLRRETSAPLQDTSERDFSVRSQPVGARNNLDIREDSAADQSGVGRSKSFTHRPHSYHHPHNHADTLPSPPSTTEANRYSNSHERQTFSNYSDHHYHEPHSSEPSRYSNHHERHDPSQPLSNDPSQHYQKGTSPYQPHRSPYNNTIASHNASRSDSESARQHYAASNSSRRSRRPHPPPSHRGSANYTHRSQRNYESDTNSVLRPDSAYHQDSEFSRHDYRNDGRYSRGHTLEREPQAWDRRDQARESDYEQSVRRHQHSGSRLDDSRSGQAWEGQGQRDVPDAVSGYQIRERNSRSAYTSEPASSTSSRPQDSRRTSHYHDNYSNPPPSQGHPVERRTFSPPSQSRSYNTSYNASYSHGNYYDPGQRSVAYDPGQRSQQEDERPALPPKSGYQGEGHHQSEHHAYRPASRLQYDSQQSQRYHHQDASYTSHQQQQLPDHGDPPPAYQQTPPQYHRPPPHNQRTPPRHQETPPRHQETPPRHQETPPRYQETPPRHQETPPKHQGTPPRYQGTPPRHQGTLPQHQGTPQNQGSLPRHSNTPPRRMGSSPGHHGDARYSQGLLSVHMREQSEGSSSQASAFAGGSIHRRSPRPTPAAADRPGVRHRGSSTNPEMAAQFHRAPIYNPELCTEL